MKARIVNISKDKIVLKNNNGKFLKVSPSKLQFNCNLGDYIEIERDGDEIYLLPLDKVAEARSDFWGDDDGGFTAKPKKHKYINFPTYLTMLEEKDKKNVRFATGSGLFLYVWAGIYVALCVAFGIFLANGTVEIPSAMQTIIGSILSIILLVVTGYNLRNNLSMGWAIFYCCWTWGLTLFSMLNYAINGANGGGVLLFVAAIDSAFALSRIRQLKKDWERYVGE